MGRRTGKAHVNTAPNFEKRVRALELRIKGWTYREIAAEIGVSHQTAYTWIEQEMERVITPPAKHLVKMELLRYDKLLRRLQEDLDAGGDPGRLGPTILRVSKARRELLGLDQPIRVDATVQEITQEDVALEAMIREAKAKQAVEAASEAHEQEEQTESAGQ